MFEKLPASTRPQLKIPKEPIRLEGVDNNVIEVQGLISLTLLIGKMEFVCDAIVAPISDHGLLGMDFLYAHDFLMGSDGLFELDGIIIHTEVEGITPKMCKVRLKEDVTIPAQTECVVSAVSDGTPSSLCIVEPIAHAPISNQVVVGSSLIDATRKMSFIPVRVMNPSTEDILLRKATSIGQLSEVENVSVLAANENSDEDHKHRTLTVCQIHQHVTGQGTDVTEATVNIPDHVQDLYSRSTQHLTPIQGEKVKRLIIKHADIFAKSPTDLGRTSMVCHTIDTGTALPIKQRPRRPPLAFAEEEEKIIQQQLEAGVIRKSTSAWSSPLVYVKKKDGTTRPCVDYRRLNEVTTKDAYPLPRIDDCLDCLSSARYFSTLDMQSGYWQLEVREEDKPKTAFITRSGLFEYITMPFGLCGAPSTFERCMEQVLRGLQWRTLLVYLDDVILFSSHVEEHISRLDEVFQRLSEAGLKLKGTKCELFQEEVSFLGHVVTSSGVKPDPKKVSSIRDWSVPRSVRDVRSFVGLCSYYRRFIKGFATIASPLHRLTEAGVAYDWTEKCQKAFDTLKQAITSDDVMAYPQDKGGTFILDTDASDTGIGGVLSQLQWNETLQAEVERPIVYASKSLTKTQRRYCVTRRELLAVVTFAQQFRHYLLGRKFLIRTDHSALRWVMTFRNPTDQMARWIELLSQFDFEMSHRAGKGHTNADGLSRITCDPEECMCYDKDKVLDELPCGGCDKCRKKHKEWESFFELDDVVPLSAKPDRTSGDLASDHRHNPISVRKVEDATMKNNLAPEGVTLAHVLWMTVIASILYVLKLPTFCGRATKWTIAALRKKPDTHSTNRDSDSLSRGTGHLTSNDHVGEACDENGQDPGGGDGDLGTTWVGGLTTQGLAESQSNDNDLGKIIGWLSDNMKPTRDDIASESPAVRKLWLMWDQLKLIDRVLYRVFQRSDQISFNQLVVPQALQGEVLSAIHNSVMSGHLGVKKTVSKAKKYFYWFQMQNSVQSWIQNCKVCSARKHPRKSPRAPLKKYTAGYPLDRACTDILGPFPTSNNGNRYILLVMDQFTRWVEAYAIPDFTAQTVAHKIVHEFVSRFGTPLELHSDQGRNYESKLFREMCVALDIHKTRTSPYHPQSNGVVERFNSTLVNMIASYVSKNQKDWDVNLPLLTAAYRCCDHASTGYTPNMLMLGREVFLPVQIALGSLHPHQDPVGTNEYVSDLRDKMSVVFSHVREHLQKAQILQKKDYDSRIALKTYKVGDAVYVLDSTKQIGLSPKLKLDRWKGPCVIIRKISDLLFEIKSSSKSKSKIIHHNRLKPYVDDKLPEWADKLAKSVVKETCNEVHSMRDDLHEDQGMGVHVGSPSMEHGNSNVIPAIDVQNNTGIDSDGGQTNTLVSDEHIDGTLLDAPTLISDIDMECVSTRSKMEGVGTNDNYCEPNVTENGVKSSELDKESLKKCSQRARKAPQRLISQM